MASSSVAALLVGGGAPSAFACYTGPFAGGHTNSGATACVTVNNTSFTGTVLNNGTISPGPTGIAVVGGSTITGGIVDQGVISASSHGILIDSTSRISGTSGIDILIGGPTFTGGITNGGTVSALVFDIFLNHVSTFAGGIANSGMLNSSGSGIGIAVSTFAGGITNSGTLIAANAGIAVVGVSTFTGGVTNSGTLNAANDTGIFVSAVKTFTGGITNTGTLSAGGGVSVHTVSTFAGGVTNSGTLSAAHTGIVLSGISTFAGGVTNSGTLSAGAGRGISLAGGSIFTGGITNSGALNAIFTGILVNGVSTLVGGITNSGTLSGNHGITVENVAAFDSGISIGGRLTANLTGISLISISTFAGGITNSGTLHAGASVIFVSSVLSFAGGIANSGTLNAGGNGIWLAADSVFAGGITNSGTLSVVGGNAIAVDNVSTFAGGIANSGVLQANGGGISVISDPTFTGGITNSGTLSASSGISVQIVSAFTGGITNSGTLHAGAAGVLVFGVSAFTGGITNNGTLSAGGNGIWVVGGSTFAGGITNSGQITASVGILVQTGVSTFDGAIVNSGTIVGTGGTAIDISSAPAAIAIDILGGAITGNMVGAGTASGDTVNFALNGGAFAYASTISGMQTVNINSGTLFDGGAITAAGVVVNSGGTLAAGLPGTTGTLSITGNLTVASGGGYEIQMTPAAHASAAVSGNLTLNNGTVELAPAGPLGVHYAATTFSILSYGGTLSGTFNPNVAYAGVVQLAAAPTVSYVANNVDLSYGATLVDLATPIGANQNEQNVITGINTAILAGAAIPAGFQQITGLNGAALLNAYAHLAGEPATDAGKGATQLMNDFLDLMLDPTAGGGGNVSGGGANTFAPEQDASLPSDVALAYAKALKQKSSSTPQAAAPSFDQRWTAWGSAFGGKSFIDGNAALGSNNVAASDYGIAAGMEYRVTPATVYGFALAGGGTNWNLAQGLGSGRSDSFQAGVYAKTHAGPFYLSGALAFANHWFTTDRSALGDQLQAKFSGQSYAARGEAGYRYAVPVTGAIVGVTPYAALQVQDFHTPSYSETDLGSGGFGLAYASQNATDTRSELGARFDNLQVIYGMPLVLRGRLAWAHDWVSNPSLGAVFQTLPGSNFTVNGAAAPKNSALTTAAAELHINANWTAIAKFDGDFASGAQTYGGTGTIRYSW